MYIYFDGLNKIAAWKVDRWAKYELLKKSYGLLYEGNAVNKFVKNQRYKMNINAVCYSNKKEYYCKVKQSNSSLREISMSTPLFSFIYAHLYWDQAEFPGAKRRRWSTCVKNLHFI